MVPYEPSEASGHVPVLDYKLILEAQELYYVCPELRVGDSPRASGDFLDLGTLAFRITGVFACSG